MKLYDQKVDASFIAEYLIDDELLSQTPITSALDTTLYVWAIFCYAYNEPELILPGDVEAAVNSSHSQIGNKENYLSHVLNTGYIFEGLVTKLLEKDPELDLPEPRVARSLGFIHDLNAIYSDYGKTGQQSKELDLYFHARHLGLPIISHSVAMHSGHLEIAQIIHDDDLSEDRAFPKSSVYAKMQDVLRSEGPLSLASINSEFNDFMQGIDNFTLMVLSVADYLENGQPTFNQDTIEEDFSVRSGDIVYRYAGKPLESGKPLSALGRALSEKGTVSRLTQYKDIIKGILFGNEEAVSRYKETYNIWK